MAWEPVSNVYDVDGPFCGYCRKPLSIFEMVALARSVSTPDGRGYKEPIRGSYHPGDCARAVLFVDGLPAFEARARQFAEEAHGVQTYGTLPYVKHLDDVAMLVSVVRSTQRPNLVALAYHHDLLEDTDKTMEDLAREVHWFHAFHVWLMTDPKVSSRRERKIVLNERLKTVGADFYFALVVKVADRVANVRESKKNNPQLFNMYRNEHHDFKDAAYRAGLCDMFWDYLDAAFR